MTVSEDTVRTWRSMFLLLLFLFLLTNALTISVIILMKHDMVEAACSSTSTPPVKGDVT